MSVIQYAIKEGAKDGVLEIYFDRLIADWDNGKTDTLRMSAIDSVEADGQTWTFWCATRKHKWKIFSPLAHEELKARLFPDSPPHD